MIKSLIQNLEAEIKKINNYLNQLNRALSTLRALGSIEVQAGALVPNIVSGGLLKPPRALPRARKASSKHSQKTYTWKACQNPNCPREGKEFRAERRHAKYCSPDCYPSNLARKAGRIKEANKANPSFKSEWVHCADCDALFETKPRKTGICDSCRSKKNSKSGKKGIMAKKNKPVTLVHGDNLSNH